jgi:hypothetical protein
MGIGYVQLVIAPWRADIKEHGRLETAANLALPRLSV